MKKNFEIALHNGSVFTASVAVRSTPVNANRNGTQEDESFIEIGLECGLPDDPQEIGGINVNVSLDDATEDLQNVIRKVLPFVDAVEGITIAIDGYNSDPRELWDIPEVSDFARRLISEGFLGIMKCPRLSDDGQLILPPGWDGLMLFLVSRNFTVTPNESRTQFLVTIDGEVMDEYFAAVMAGNRIIHDRYFPDSTGQQRHEAAMKKEEENFMDTELDQFDQNEIDAAVRQHENASDEQPAERIRSRQRLLANLRQRSACHARHAEDCEPSNWYDRMMNYCERVELGLEPTPPPVDAPDGPSVIRPAATKQAKSAA